MAITYRTVMEVLKWVEFKQTLSAAALVNTHFLTVSDSDELWYSYIDLLGYDLTTLSSTVSTPKACFRELRERYRILQENYFISYCGTELITQRCPLPWKIGHFSAAAFISTTDLFVCGGSVKASEAYLLHIDTGAVRPLPDMLYPRKYHAVIFLQKKVYAFGGLGVERNAEKYDVSKGRWTQLPDMGSTHSSFNVCSEGDLVYLCGGHTVYCEAFNYVTEVYTPLPFQLGTANWTIAFIYEKELIAVVNSTFFYPNSQNKKEKEGQLALIP